MTIIRKPLTIILCTLVMLLLSSMCHAEPIVWYDTQYDWKSVKSMSVEELNTSQARVESSVIERVLKEQLQKSAQKAKLDIMPSSMSDNADIKVSASLTRLDKVIARIPVQTRIALAKPLGVHHHHHHHGWGWGPGFWWPPAPAVITVEEAPYEKIMYRATIQSKVISKKTSQSIMEYEETCLFEEDELQSSLKDMMNRLFQEVKRRTH